MGIPEDKQKEEGAECHWHRNGTEPRVRPQKVSAYAPGDGQREETGVLNDVHHFVVKRRGEWGSSLVHMAGHSSHRKGVRIGLVEEVAPENKAFVDVQRDKKIRNDKRESICKG